MSKSPFVTNVQRRTLISRTAAVAMPFVAIAIVSSFLTAGGSLGSTGSGVVAIGNGGGGGGRGQACQPSEAIVVRELPCGSSISMRIDLNKALQDPSQRILIKPNDVVILRYTITEEIGNAVLNMLQINYFLNSIGR
jgi:hypothetical protein